MTTYTKEANRTAINTESRSFCHTDRFGRVIGGLAYTWEADFVPQTEGAFGYVSIEPGHYFVFAPTATRDGRRYGASQRDQRYTTREERDAAVEAYFKAAERRAAKRAGK